jgi:DNA-binding SARP family transcriptional activator
VFARLEASVMVRLAMTYRLTTLGSLSISSHDGLRTALATRRRALALLALAAESGDAGVSRDRAMALLWPELDDSAARNNLKQTVFQIRHALSVEAFDRHSSDLRLDFDVIQADVHDFQRALASFTYEAAATHYAGPFLLGFHLGSNREFDQWAERVRARLGWGNVHALERLVATARSRGDSAMAIHWCRRLVEQDPVSTAYALSLMSTLIDAGEPLAAVRHGQAHAQLIREEFESEVDARILAAIDVAKRVIARRPPVAAPSRWENAS